MGTGRSLARNGFIIVVVLLLGALIASAALAVSKRPPNHDPPIQNTYPWHSNIKVTVFWIGEKADDSNDHIHNRASVWTTDWVKAYGGVDDPDDRCGHNPCGFMPKENPFYAALPYNDLDDHCRPKDNQNSVYWYTGKTHGNQSLVKNRWIQVKVDGKSAYAQIEDSGPFGEDDVGYVFGDHPPKEQRSGLDLSPAAAQYLGADGGDGKDYVAWRFVEEREVPDGPWRSVVTHSNPDCQ